jgi:ribonuclease P protein component
MLPKEYRLKKRSAYTATYKTGKAVHKDGITMFVGKNKNNDYPTKVGFVVSKKIHKRAVKRNRIKRLMRESYRLLIKEGSVSDKYISLIFVASSKLIDKDFKFVDEAIRKLVYKI